MRTYSQMAELIAVRERWDMLGKTRAENTLNVNGKCNETDPHLTAATGTHDPGCKDEFQYDIPLEKRDWQLQKDVGFYEDDVEK